MSRHWSELSRDGDRLHLVGRAVHCGTSVELRQISRDPDDGNQRATDSSLRVRYEVQRTRTGVRHVVHYRAGGHEFVAEIMSYMQFRWPA